MLPLHNRDFGCGEAVEPVDKPVDLGFEGGHEKVAQTFLSARQAGMPAPPWPRGCGRRGLTPACWRWLWPWQRSSRVSVLAEEKGAGGKGDGKDAEKGADRFAEVVGREVCFGVDAAGEREGFA